MTAWRPRLVVELCAGTAALSWWLLGARFPVSRQGSKAGYARAIASTLGMRQHESAPDAFLWVEPDEELARTLALLTTPGGPQAVAEVIRSWIPCPSGHVAGSTTRCDDCDPDVAGRSTGRQDARRLWERLRAARPEASPEREAAAAWLGATSFRRRGVAAGFGGEATPQAPGFAVNPEFGVDAAGRALSPHGGERRALARSIDALSAARYVWIQGRTYNGKVGNETFRPEISANGVEVWNAHPQGWFADACDALPGDGRGAAAPTVSVLCCGAADIDPTEVLRASGPADVLVYIDPPYLGTTGYLHDLGRDDVLAVARRWADAGCCVVVSECEPLPLQGWYHAEITDARIGQARTFSTERGRTEWLTLSRKPVPRHCWPARDALPGQASLWGAT